MEEQNKNNKNETEGYRPSAAEDSPTPGNIHEPTIQPDISFAQEVESNQHVLSPVSINEASATADIYPNPIKDETSKASVDTAQGYQKVADSMLKEQRNTRVTISALDELASEVAPDLQSEAVSRNKFLSDIGMSWFTWLLIEGAVSGLIFWLHWPRIVYSAIMIPIIIFLIIKKS